MRKDLTPREALEAFARYFEETGASIGMNPNVVAAVPRIARAWADKELGALEPRHNRQFGGHGMELCSGTRKTDGRGCRNWGYPNFGGKYWCRLHEDQAVQP